MLRIREVAASDREAIWNIFHGVVATGDTYAFDPAITCEEALAYWLQSSHRCYVAEHGRNVVGTYVLKANQPSLGSHVANAAFMVSPSVRGLGIGRNMGQHSLREARRLGYRAMQFN